MPHTVPAALTYRLTRLRDRTLAARPGSNSGVRSQAVSYLSWLDSARHAFEALVKVELGTEAAEAIDWWNPLMVCIAASFSSTTGSRYAG